MGKAEKRCEYPLKELRRQIRIGLDQADCGELLDGEMVFEEILRRMPNRRAPRFRPFGAGLLSRPRLLPELPPRQRELRCCDGDADTCFGNLGSGSVFRMARVGTGDHDHRDVLRAEFHDGS